MKTLNGKVAVVTGATKGIGKGIARVLAGKGARVVLAGRSVPEGEATVREIQAAGREALFITADVTREADMKNLMESAAAAFGGVDILCANAGIFPACKFEEMTERHWDEVFDVNLKGMFFSVKAAHPWLKQSKAGRIILTSSITGPYTGYPGWSHYGATKAGMLGFMRTSAIEMAKYGITVNAVLPGNIISEGVIALGEDYIKTMSASVPLKKLGTVDDIGYAAAFLASEEAGFINGHALIVDGGQILPESSQALEAV